MESKNNNQMLLLAVAAVALYFFMKYRKCSKQENFTDVKYMYLKKNDKKIKEKRIPVIDRLPLCKIRKINELIQDGKCKNEVQCRREYIEEKRRTRGQIIEKECLCKGWYDDYIDNDVVDDSDWGNCRKLAAHNCHRPHC